MYLDVRGKSLRHNGSLITNVRFPGESPTVIVIAQSCVRKYSVSMYCYYCSLKKEMVTSLDG